jgi:signal transduction histidine kinase
MKAGLMEIANIFVVNKADRPGADQLVVELEAMLSLNPRNSYWQVPVLCTQAINNIGIEELYREIERHRNILESTGRLSEQRQKQRREELIKAIEQGVSERLSKLMQKHTPPDDPKCEDLEIIVTETTRCRDIVKGLLEFSHQTESKPAPTDVNDVVNKTLMLLQQQASFHNVRTTLALDAALPPILIDPGHLQQVVLNLFMKIIILRVQRGDTPGAIQFYDRYRSLIPLAEEMDTVDALVAGLRKRQVLRKGRRDL